MHVQATGNQVQVRGGVFRQRVAIAAGFDQAAAVHQRLQALGQLLALAAPQAHLANQLLVSGGAMGLPFDVAQDGLVGNHLAPFLRCPMWLSRVAVS